MSMTLFDAQKISRNAYATMLFKQIATSDDLFSMLPFVPKAGEGFSYPREKTIGSFNFITPGGSVANSTGTVERVTIEKAEATEDFWVDNFAQENMSDQLSPLELQEMMKLKAAGRAIAGKVVTGARVDGFSIQAFQSGAYVDALVAASPYIRTRESVGEIKYTHSGTLVQFRAPGDTEFGTAVAAASDANYTLYSGDPSKWITVTLDVSDATADAIRSITFTSTSKEFEGLSRLVAPSQIRLATATDGDALSFEIMDQLYDAVKQRDNLAWVMHSALRRKLATLLRAAGGVEPGYLLQSGASVPTYNGIPVLVNDFVPTNETKGSGTTLSSVYLVNLNPENGLYMGALGGSTMQVNTDPRDATVLGFRMFDLGQHQTESKVGRRLMWSGGLACGSDLSLACARQIITGLT